MIIGSPRWPSGKDFPSGAADLGSIPPFYTLLGGKQSTSQQSPSFRNDLTSKVYTALNPQELTIHLSNLSLLPLLGRGQRRFIADSRYARKETAKGEKSAPRWISHVPHTGPPPPSVGAESTRLSLLAAVAPFTSSRLDHIVQDNSNEARVCAATGV